MNRQVLKRGFGKQGFPFECLNCGNKPTARQVVDKNAICEICGDEIIAYTIDTAEMILKLMNSIDCGEIVDSFGTEI